MTCRDCAPICPTCLTPMVRIDGRVRCACPDAEQWAFETFAAAYPHEAHAESPDRFWEAFQRVRPGVSREEMERAMAATEREGT